MILITGDTHGNGDIQKLKGNSFTLQSQLTKEDYVIVCGDFGGIFWGTYTENQKELERLLTARGRIEKEEGSEGLNPLCKLYAINQQIEYLQLKLTRYRYYLEEERKLRAYLKKRNYTLLFIDGNHENFTLLNQYPKEEWKGGTIHRVSENIIHLCRGNVFEIEGYRIFTFGGARSHDIYDSVGRQRRFYGLNVWEEEMPTAEEMERGLEALKRYNNKVDLILTHSLPTSTIATSTYLCSSYDSLTNYFDKISEITDYTLWLSGHYHIYAPCQVNVESLSGKGKEEVEKKIKEGVKRGNGVEERAVSDILKMSALLKEAKNPKYADIEYLEMLYRKQTKQYMIYNGIYEMQRTLDDTVPIVMKNIARQKKQKQQKVS